MGKIRIIFARKPKDPDKHNYSEKGRFLKVFNDLESAAKFIVRSQKSLAIWTVRFSRSSDSMTLFYKVRAIDPLFGKKD